MVDRLSNVIPNINQFYKHWTNGFSYVDHRTVLMAKDVSQQKPIKIDGVGVLMMVLFLSGIRQQTAVGDVQFLKSMIPHHAGLFLWSKKVIWSIRKEKSWARNYQSTGGRNCRHEGEN